MVHALALASEAAAAGEIPVGAVVLNADGEILGVGRNDREETADPTGHAEVVAMRAAAQTIGSWNLQDTTLVVTMEPCVMCAGTALQARVSRVVFGAWDDKAGAAGSVYDVLRDRRLPVRAEVVGGVRAEDAVALLQDFFRGRR
ncbi:nucleoside deaminase [Microbacterium gorillae]|uniref:nucleoside deaminase n=1 Tax=Microbacterium gorillae TaxID=1231063 RepID=UPI003D9805CF